MKKSNKLAVLIAMLFFAIAGLLTYPQQQSKASSGICDTFHNDDGNPCFGEPTNCYCPIIIRPD